MKNKLEELFIGLFITLMLTGIPEILALGAISKIFGL